MTRLVLTAASLLLAASPASAEGEPAPPRFRIDVPAFVLSGVPVRRIEIVALDEAGRVDRTFDARPDVEGVRLTVGGEERELPAFEKGRLVLETNLRAGPEGVRKVFVIRDDIRVEPDGPGSTTVSVRRISGWWSLLPPLLAIVLAVWTRQVFVALFVGVWGGAVVLAGGNVFAGFYQTLDAYVVGQVADRDHALILLFTLFLGAMVGTMSRSGGTAALVDWLTGYTRTRRHGQVVTWALGLVVFFDDYANTLLVGSTMRPLTDRLRISREKLAFLVDSTAAPIAGLAIVSTWVGVEIGYIGDAYQRLGLGSEVYGTFLATIPFRFYPVLLLLFVLLIGLTGRDYGTMLQAERRAVHDGQPVREGSIVPEDTEDPRDHDRPLLRNAIVPLVVLVLGMLVGLWWTGSQALATENATRAAAGEDELAVTPWRVLSNANSSQVLLVSSFLASLAAMGMAVAFRSLNLGDAVQAWVEGAKQMFAACIVLVLAWGVATVCDAEHLNTAGFLVERTSGFVSAAWMPTLAFLLSAVVAFATGTSWATMGLLLPLFIPLTYYLLPQSGGTVDPNHPLLLGSIGGILAGAIFGDHCSPISDTTVLSSAASGCDHLDHVATQLPYATTVAAVSILLGYVPAGFGVSPWLGLVAGAGVLVGILLARGRTVDDRLGAGSVDRGS